MDLSEMGEELEALAEMEDMGLLNDADTARLRSVAYQATRSRMPSNASNVDISNTAEAFVRMARNGWNEPFTVAAVLSSPLFEVQLNNWRASRGLTTVNVISGPNLPFGLDSGTFLGVNKKYLLYGALALGGLYFFKKMRS